MDSSAIGGGGQGAMGIQGQMASQVMAGGAQAAPAPAPQDNAARAAAMQAEGKGQKLDITA